MSDVWYYGDSGKAVGPLSLADLTRTLSGVANAKDVLVWRDGFGRWQRAETVPELVANLFNLSKPPPLPPPSPPLSPTHLPSKPLLVPAAVNAGDDRPQHQEPRMEASGRRRNIIVAIVLSAIVLVGWQYFFNIPQMEKQRATHPVQSQMANKPGEQAGASQARPPSAASVVSRDIAIASVPRVKINTPSITGSVSLKGARIDDVTLVKYKETADPSSPAIVLLSPTATDSPLYAEFGWIVAGGSALKIPDQNTVWQQEGSGSLSPESPVTLKYDNGEGLTFRRTISIDDRYLFTIKDEVTNVGNAPVTLYPFALVSRHGAPSVLSSYIAFGGLIGYLGDQGLQEYGYKKIDDDKAVSFEVTDGWLGITDKYWAAVLLPDTDAQLQARFSSHTVGTARYYQADYLQAPQIIAIGGTGSAHVRLFAGVKEASIIGVNFPFDGPGGYNKQLGLNHFDLLIDWGWFYFIIKPMFLALAFFNHLVGNFGVAILILAVIVKVIFVPFANKSYRSMKMMQHLQPQIAAIHERADDRSQADREILELYKRENVTAPSGCLPIFAQFLIYFTLYKILNVAIEAHSPFFGWINDLAAPDPSNLFNLFGLLTFDPTTVPLFGQYLHIGAWPVILGLTLWQLQRKIRPIKLGSFRRTVYAILPIIAIYSTNSMVAGAVIYLAFYNFLSIFHELLLMKDTEGTIGISEYSAEILPYGKIQPIVFLMMLAPVLQNVFMFLVFWRRSKKPKAVSIVGR